MKDAGELRNTIGMLRVGDKVEIGLLRDGKPRKVTALIAERSETEAANAADINQGLEGAELADAPDGGGVLVQSGAGRQSGGASRPARQRLDRRRRPHADLQHQDAARGRERREVSWCSMCGAVPPWC